MKKATKDIRTGRRARDTAEDRPTADAVRRDDAQPDSPRRGGVSQDDSLIGATRLPRKGDDDMTP